MPWYAKLLAAATAAYALSPIDLIPDFIPVIGYLDDLILLPLAIALVIRLVPAEIMADLRRRAAARLAEKTSSGRVVIATWVVVAVAGLAVAGWVWVI